MLRKYGRDEITIIGHTDAVGSDSYPVALGAPAAAVRDQLMRGVPASRLIAIGRSEFEPRADNGTEAGRQLNRRVEILVQTTA